VNDSDECHKQQRRQEDFVVRRHGFGLLPRIASPITEAAIQIAAMAQAQA